VQSYLGRALQPAQSLAYSGFGCFPTLPSSRVADMWLSAGTASRDGLRACMLVRFGEGGLPISARYRLDEVGQVSRRVRSSVTRQMENQHPPDPARTKRRPEVHHGRRSLCAGSGAAAGRGLTSEAAREATLPPFEPTSVLDPVTYGSESSRRFIASDVAYPSLGRCQSDCACGRSLRRPGPEGVDRTRDPFVNKRRPPSPSRPNLPKGLTTTPGGGSGRLFSQPPHGRSDTTSPLGRRTHTTVQIPGPQPPPDLASDARLFSSTGLIPRDLSPLLRARPSTSEGCNLRRRTRRSCRMS
jgi:hypothetical protein